MQLTPREAASYLGVTEAVLRRWIAQRELPVHRANEREYLNAVEVWEWAVEHNVAVSRSLLDRARRNPDELPPMSELLRRGGIVHDLPGTDTPGALRALVQHLPLPAEIDRDFLFSILEAREAMGSTGIGDGIAIPHVRNPIVLQVEAPFVTLCLLRQAVDFGAIDGQPVHALFVVVSPTVPGHLRALAQLGFLLRDDVLRGLLRDRAPEHAIMTRIVHLESQAQRRSSAPHAPAAPR